MSTYLGRNVFCKPTLYSQEGMPLEERIAFSSRRHSQPAILHPRCLSMFSGARPICPQSGQCSQCVLRIKSYIPGVPQLVDFASGAKPSFGRTKSYVLERLSSFCRLGSDAPISFSVLRKLMGEGIRPQLEMHQARRRGLASFHVPNRNWRIVRPHSTTFPPRFSIVDTAVQST